MGRSRVSKCVFHRAKPGIVGVVVLAAIGLVNCGGSSGVENPLAPVAPNKTLTAADLQRAVSAMSDAAASGMDTAVGKTKVSLTSPAGLNGVKSLTKVFNYGEAIPPVTMACDKSGSLLVTGTMSGSITVNTDTGSVFGSILFEEQMSYAFCSYDGYWTFRRADSTPIRGNGTMFINNDRISLNMGMSGGLIIDGNKGETYTCQYENALIQYDNLTGISKSGSVNCNGISAHL